MPRVLVAVIALLVPAAPAWSLSVLFHTACSVLTGCEGALTSSTDVTVVPEPVVLVHTTAVLGREVAVLTVVGAAVSDVVGIRGAIAAAGWCIAGSAVPIAVDC